MSVLSTTADRASLRLLEAFFALRRCRRPALFRRALPVPVNLKRFANDFLVLLRATDFRIKGEEDAAERAEAQMKIPEKVDCCRMPLPGVALPGLRSAPPRAVDVHPVGGACAVLRVGQRPTNHANGMAVDSPG